MALGYENTGIGPKLIANAGNAMTESIRQFGEKLSRDIERHNIEKQTAGFLQESALLDMEDPRYPALLQGVKAKYPGSAFHPAAKVGEQMMMTGWETKQRQKLAETRYGGGSTPYEPPVTPAGALGSGGLLGGGPMPPPAGEDSMLGSPEPGFGFGGGLRGKSRLGVDFNPPEDSGLPISGGVVGEEPIVAKDPTALPTPLSPDRQALLNRYMQSQKGRPEKEARRNIAQMEYRLISEQSQENTAKRKPSNNKPIFRTIPGVGVGVWNPETRSFDVAAEGKPTQRWINLGSHWENTETGEQKPIELSPAQRSAEEGRQAANEDRDRKAKFDIVKLKVGDLAKRRAEVMVTRTQAEKAGNSELALQRWNEAKAIDGAINALTEGLTKEEKVELGVEEAVENKETPQQIRDRIKAAGGTYEDFVKALRDAGHNPTD